LSGHATIVLAGIDDSGEIEETHVALTAACSPSDKGGVEPNKQLAPIGYITDWAWACGLTLEDFAGADHVLLYI